MKLCYYKDAEGEWWVEQVEVNVDDQPQRVGSIDLLPDNVKGKLLMLHLLDPPAHLDKVGDRVSENTFWLVV